MSEHAPKHEGGHEALTQAEIHELQKSKHEAAAVHKAEKDPALAAHEARTTVEELKQSETQPNPLDKLKEAENTPQKDTPRFVNRELKKVTLRRELQHIRRKLPASQRALSRVIHQPAIRVVSEGVGKTASRPSGLLGGGIVALLGTSSYLYLAKHIGFKYNYGVFLALFVAGFALGIALEFLVYLATSSRRKAES